MNAGIARFIGAALGSGVIFALYAVALPIAVMTVVLYIVRIFPLAGRWPKQLRKRWGERNETPKRKKP